MFGGELLFWGSQYPPPHRKATLIFLYLFNILNVLLLFKPFQGTLARTAQKTLITQQGSAFSLALNYSVTLCR